MREDEFEKRVREKMEHLGFDPSESVWTGVDKEINQEKKLRVPLFWLFFVSGVLLAGGAYYFITNKNTSATVAKIPEQGIAKKQNEEKATQSPEPAGIVNQSTHFTSPSSTNQKSVSHSVGAGFDKKGTRRTTGVTNEMNGFRESSVAAGTGDIAINNYSNKSDKTATDQANKKIMDSTAGKMAAAEKVNKSKDSVITSATAKNKAKKTKGSSWKWGFTGGIGSSNLNQNLFNSVKTLSPVTLTTSAARTTNAGYLNYSSSEINPGFSFEAGAFVIRNLSKHISFSAGLNYHYYSTTIRTGGKINTTMVTTNSFNQIIVANSYYENTGTQTFTSQYHFIEIPLSVNYQLNKSKRTPIIWELGLTPGYIVSSHALYYDPHTNEYYNNYLKPNKMQLNGVTALIIGFPLHTGQLQIGPQLQYGFTGFVHTNDGNPGHLFYAGLKISFIAGKK